MSLLCGDFAVQELYLPASLQSPEVDALSAMPSTFQVSMLSAAIPAAAAILAAIALLPSVSGGFCRARPLEASRIDNRGRRQSYLSTRARISGKAFCR